jgi:hypothetical protein
VLFQPTDTQSGLQYLGGPAETAFHIELLSALVWIVSLLLVISGPFLLLKHPTRKRTGGRTY